MKWRLFRNHYLTKTAAFSSLTDTLRPFGLKRMQSSHMSLPRNYTKFPAEIAIFSMELHPQRNPRPASGPVWPGFDFPVTFLYAYSFICLNC